MAQGNQHRPGMKPAETSTIARVRRSVDGGHEDLAREECRGGDETQDKRGGPIDAGCQRDAGKGASDDKDVEVREGAAQERACLVGRKRAEQERSEAERVQDHPPE